MVFNITEEDIDQWAETRREAESVLPDLVRRLICSIVKSEEIMYIRFPAYKAVNSAGLDGVLETKNSTIFSTIPISAWEFSIRKDASTKADEDYKKRTKNTPLNIREKTAYITVTAHSWSIKDKWTNEKKILNEWGDIKAYDASDIATWLLISIPVSIWFSQKLGKPVDGLYSAEEYLKNWLERTKPALNQEVVLAGRENEIKIIEEWFSKAPNILRIKAETIEESVIFVCSVLCHKRINTKDTNAIVIKDRFAWERIIRSFSGQDTTNPYILIPAYAGFDGAISIAEKHHLLIPYEIGQIIKQPNIILGSINRENLTKALTTVLNNEDKAKRIAYESGGKLTSIQRFLGFTQEIPPWVLEFKNSEIVIALLLAGGWNPNLKGDKEVLSKLSNNKPFEQIAKVITELLNVKDTPLRKQGHIQKWRSLRDAWTLLAQYITKPDLERFEEICIEILSKPNPKYDLPINERYMASIYNKVFTESDDLRMGLANTLAWLNLNYQEIERITGQDTVGVIILRIIRKVLNNNWKVWASLDSGLRTFAEASPKIFLEELQKDINDPTKEMQQLFCQDPKNSGGFGGECCHSELLWALEVLAWNREYYGLVTEILIDLCKLDPGGTYANRPFEILFSLFDPFFVQTATPIDERIKVLKIICKKHPSEGWELVKKIMERYHHGGIGTCNARPLFCDWEIPPAFSTLQPENLKKYVKASYEIFLNFLCNDTIKCIEIINDHLLPSGLGDILDIVERNLKMFSSLDIRLKLQSSLRRYIHFEYLREKEKISEINKDIDRAKDLIEKLNSGKIEEDCAWLFSIRPDLPEPCSKDYNKEEERIKELRSKTLLQILQSDSCLAELLFLAELSSRPGFVGYTLGLLPESNSIEKGINELIKNNSQPQFISGFIAGKFQRTDVNWLLGKAKELVNGGLFQEATQILISVTSNIEIRKWIKQYPEIEKIYWKHAPVTYTGVSDTDDFRLIVNNLLEVGRWNDAIDFAVWAYQRKIPIILEVYIDILRYGTKLTKKDEIFKINSWDIEEIFKAIDELKNDFCSEEELARLEILYIPFLKHSERPPKYISRILNKSPEIFVEILCYIYRKHNEIKEEISEDEKDKRANLARTGYAILSNWKEYPGIDEKTTEERDKYLSKWCQTAMQLAKKQDREKITLIEIGHILTRVPNSEKDGIWPCEVAREFIENGIHEIAEGLQTSMYNSRGFTSRDLTDGGKQERDVSARYRKDAEKLICEFPRTSAFLKKVADGYEYDARRFDEHAEEYIDP